MWSLDRLGAGLMCDRRLCALNTPGSVSGQSDCPPWAEGGGHTPRWCGDSWRSPGWNPSLVALVIITSP